VVEEQHHASTIVEIIGAKLDILIPRVLQHEHMSREAMADLLKFTFNLLVHYPKVFEWFLALDYATDYCR